MSVTPNQPPPYAPWQATAGWANAYAAVSTPVTPPPTPKTRRPSAFSWLLLIAGLVSVSLSFLPYYALTTTLTVSGIDYTASGTYDAWHGIYGWLAAVLLAVSAVFTIVYILAAKARAPLSVVVMLICVLALASAVASHYIYVTVVGVEYFAGQDYFTLDKQFGIGHWLILICAAVAVISAIFMMSSAFRRAPAVAQPVVPQPPVVPPWPAPTTMPYAA